MSARKQGENLAAWGVQHRVDHGTRLATRNLDDAGLMQQPGLNAGTVRRRTDKQYAAMLAFADQIAEQGIIGPRETQIDHLSMCIKCRCERARKGERIAACGVGIGMRLPACLEYQEARVWR